MSTRLLAASLVVFTVASGAACGKHSPAGSAAPLKVAAAADLSFAFKDLGDAYEKQTGQKITFTFGSTGQLAKQIQEGAPFDLFAAANVSFVNDVVKAGDCDGATQTMYARGRIVVWWKKGSGKEPPKTLADLADPRFEKIAIANPEHAPYGKAAQQAFESAGIADAVKPRLVFGENVQQTLQFAQSGNVDAAVVALSLATVTQGGDFVLIDEGAHKPLEQAMVACGKTRGEDAKKFIAFVGSEAGRAIMRRYGFLLPGEAAPAPGAPAGAGSGGK